jgi:hypothetical protein
LNFARGHKVQLQAETELHRIQIVRLGKETRHVSLDGKPIRVSKDADGIQSFECRLDGAHEMIVRVS